MSKDGPTLKEIEQAAVGSPDARWLYLGRGEEGKIRPGGNKAVFLISWKGRGQEAVRPPRDWQHGPIEVPATINAFREVPFEDLPTLLAALIFENVPILVWSDGDEDPFGTTIEDLLPAIEGARKVGPNLLKQQISDRRLEVEEAQRLRRRLDEAVETFRHAGWTTPIDEHPATVESTAPRARYDHLPIPSPSIYAGVQRALALNRFERIEGAAFPRALLSRGQTMGFAELRPITPQEEILMDPEEVGVLAERMWQWREELSDQDADVMDAIAAKWIRAAPKTASERVPIAIDDLLRLRGLREKKDGSGERYGYERKQRNALWRSLLRLQEIWIDIAEAKVVEKDRSGRRRRRTRTLQSRAFLLSDRVGQRRLDGTMDVEAILVAPGEAFGRFLLGPGRQVALLSSKALAYDPKRRQSEKRLTRFFAWQWRIGAKDGAFTRRYRVRTLLDETGLETTDGKRSRPNRARKRLEEALELLLTDGVIAHWQYSEGWDENALPARGWAERWKEASIVVEAADTIKNAYRHLELAPARPRVEARKSTWGSRIRERRQEIGVSQTVAAEQLSISQSYMSQLERGRKEPTSGLKRRLEQWLNSGSITETGAIVGVQDSGT